MGFLSKKSMLVSLLALSLAACASGTKSPPPKPPPKETPINLLCDGNGGTNTIDKNPHAIKFQIQTGSACDLIDVNFATDDGKNHFKKRTSATSSAATSGDPPVVFDYDGQPIPGGAQFNYSVTKGSWNLTGNGSGVIKTQ